MDDDELEAPQDQAVRTDSDGISYQWDTEKQAWFPMWNESLIESQQSVYGSGQDAEMPREAINVRKRKNTEDEAEGGKKKGKTAEPRPNTSVYVTGLPPDTTIPEMKEFFVKCGVLMEDVVTGQPKIKLYCDANQKFKGDALVTYFKPESVSLAIDILDDREFRDGEGGRIRVQEAVFTPKEKPATNAKITKGDKKKIQKKLQKLQSRLEWDEEESNKKKEKLNKIVVLKHMFTKEEIDNDPTLLLDLKEEVRDECSKFGEITNVILYENHEEGAMSIRFKEAESAAACVQRNNGRFFGKRKIKAYIYDGIEKLEKPKSKESLEEEEAKRLQNFESWLEKS
ncbi:hypothetical protein HDU76_003352 [Blyttiomyces sp. JEL0837]|nr:hypothetical protein HDU76_003352 [Blyttiomyces sp. JEL0837]